MTVTDSVPDVMSHEAHCDHARSITPWHSYFPSFSSGFCSQGWASAPFMPLVCPAFQDHIPTLSHPGAFTVSSSGPRRAVGLYPIGQ